MTADGEGNFPLLKHKIAQFKMQNRCSFFLFSEFKNNSASFSLATCHGSLTCCNRMQRALLLPLNFKD